MAIYITLFLSGLLTILLPCILPLLPIVLGVSVAGRSKWRPLFTVLGMVISFVVFTYILLTALNQFYEFADHIRIASYFALVLFGIAFATSDRSLQYSAAVLGSLFFYQKGWLTVVVAALVGILLLEWGSRIAGRIQTLGAKLQTGARNELGADSPWNALVIGLTLGLVWAPCAGPALGFALTLVREQPGVMALLALLSYALGTAVPLLLIGYGGQAAVHSVRAITPYSGRIKQVAGVLLILTGIGLHFETFMYLQLWVGENTNFGQMIDRLENRLFKGQEPSDSSLPLDSMNTSKLPKIVRAPEFASLGPWHNSEPFTLASQKGKVVLIDFWTYSCINCIRTLPYIQGYWDKYKDTGKFVLLGVHSPEFTFEKSQQNVAMAIKEHGLTYPTAQDNSFGTWSAFANRYWPAKYLIDAEGYVRYTHFGEGDYEETDRAIESLLQEIGVETTGDAITEKDATTRRPISTETYIGERSWPAFGSATGEPTGDTVTYQAPAELVLNKYYLTGSWQLVEGELQALRSNTGEVSMKFQGGEINLVLGLEPGAKPVEAEVFIDGKSFKTFTVDRHDLYELFKGDYGQHDMVLKLKGKGVEAFAFTFGS